MSQKKSKKPKRVRKDWVVTAQVAMTEKKMSKPKTRAKLYKVLKSLGMTVHNIRIDEIHDRSGTGEDTSR